MEIRYVDEIEDLLKIRVHGNKPTCNPYLLEINPAIGCQFQCQYCNAYMQEKENHFLSVKVYPAYPQYLDAYIKENFEYAKKCSFYFSPKVEAFQPCLVDSGISYQILSVLKKYNLKCIIVTKSGRLPAELEELLVEMKDLIQIIISCSMPNEEIRKVVEPGASPIDDRVDFAQFCMMQGIRTTVIFSPIFPVDNYCYIKKYINLFYAMGITHFRLNFAEITKEAYEKLIVLMPNYEEDFKSAYITDDAIKYTWKIPYTDRQITRYFPSIGYMKRVFDEIKEYGKTINKEITFSICNSLCTLDELKGFNNEAYSKGFSCIGYRW